MREDTACERETEGARENEREGERESYRVRERDRGSERDRASEREREREQESTATTAFDFDRRKLLIHTQSVLKIASAHFCSVLCIAL